MPVEFAEVAERITDAARKVEADADTRLAPEVRESVLAAHFAICKLKAGARHPLINNALEELTHGRSRDHH